MGTHQDQMMALENTGLMLLLAAAALAVKVQDPAPLMRTSAGNSANFSSLSDAGAAWKLAYANTVMVSSSRPIHEGITYDALDAVFPEQRTIQKNKDDLWGNIFNAYSTGDHVKGCPNEFAREILRGVYWNDDPTALLFYDDEPTLTKPPCETTGWWERGFTLLFGFVPVLKVECKKWWWTWQIPTYATRTTDNYSSSTQWTSGVHPLAPPWPKCWSGAK